MAPFGRFIEPGMKRMFASNRRLFGTVLGQTMGYLDAGVADAFRTPQSRPQLGAGRVIVRVDADYMAPVLGEKPTPTPRLRRRQGATYMVPGGLGGLGRPLLRWMAGRGARNIVTMSRSGAFGAAAQQLVAELAARGTYVHVFACGIGEEAPSPRPGPAWHKHRSGLDAQRRLHR